MVALYIQINIFSRNVKIANVAKKETLKFSVKKVDKVQISTVPEVKELMFRTLALRQRVGGEWLQMGRTRTVIGGNIVK